MFDGYPAFCLQLALSAPCQGGAWERMVRSCMRVIYRVLRSRKLTDEVLKLILCLLESSLNPRPFTPVSGVPDNFEVLPPKFSLPVQRRLNVHVSKVERELLSLFTICS